MSGDIRPWYRWHTYRYESSKHVLEFCLSTDPARAHGCYRSLLDAMWKRGCELPTNREILWTLANCKNREQYEEVADLVEACFTTSEDGKMFTSELLRAEWDSATAILDKKREAAKKGGQASAQARAKQVVEQSAKQKPSTVAVAVAVSDKREIGEEDQVRKIWFSHPAKSHIDPKKTFQLPQADVDVIIQAIEADGYDLVLAGTRNYADAVAKWAKEDRRFIVPVNRFYLPTVREYAKDPSEWERKPKAMAAVVGGASIGMHDHGPTPLPPEELSAVLERQRKARTQ